MVRILQVHNYYQQPGGEDAVVVNERRNLLAGPNNIDVYTENNDQIRGAWSAFKTAAQLPYSQRARIQLASKLAEFCPHVVHVHNFFPMLTPSIYDACVDAGVPVVQTLHNYRPLCAGALLMRGGRPCEDCVRGTPFQAVLHRCYRESRPASLAVSRMIHHHRRKRTWETKVNRYIALTKFAKSRFVAAGFPDEKIAVKPNFVEDFAQEAGLRKGALFVGRLSPEKGIQTLMRAWQGADVSLRVVGDGPMVGHFDATELSDVEILGRLPSSAVALEMARAEFLVMPSEWYEGFPMVLVEAFCQGLPVIASRLGSMAEIVEDGVTGLHFTAGDPADLAAKVRWAAAHPEEMRQLGWNARLVYEQNYTPESNYKQLMAIYEQALESSRARPTI